MEIEEAMSHENNTPENVPESLKTNGQKSLSTIPLGDGLGNGCEQGKTIQVSGLNANATEFRIEIEPQIINLNDDMDDEIPFLTSGTQILEAEALAAMASIGNESDIEQTERSKNPVRETAFDISLETQNKSSSFDDDELTIANLYAHGMENSTEPMNHFYISPFDPTRNEEHVIKHLTKNGIQTHNIEVKKLVGHNYNIDTLTYVSFKVSCTNDYTHVICNSDFWPQGTKIEPFTPRDKKNTMTNSINFLRRNSNRANGT